MHGPRRNWRPPRRSWCGRDRWSSPGRPIGGPYDLTHLRALHRHLFQDVYPFARYLRTVDLRKADDPDGWFCPASRLTQEADVAFAALAQDKHLRGRDRILVRVARAT